MLLFPWHCGSTALRAGSTDFTCDMRNLRQNHNSTVVGTKKPHDNYCRFRQDGKFLRAQKVTARWDPRRRLIG